MSDWSSATIERIDIRTIRPMKLAPPWWALLKVLLVMAHVLRPRNGDWLPRLVQEHPGVGSYVIEDGHHRITVLSLMGCRSVRARVLPASSGGAG